MLPQWHPHFELWAIIFVLGFGYWYADTRIRPLVAPGAKGPTTRQRWQWFGGLALMAVFGGYPLHDVAETSLFTVHMAEHIVLTLVVPPLLLMGTPRWLADATFGHRWIRGWLRPLARPLPAFIIFNVTFILIHSPDLVELMVTNPVAHFSIHSWLFAAATLMWLPILSPTPVIPKLERPMQMFYLFMQSLLPTVPASFLTFSSVALYPVYGDAALEFGLTAVADQTIAGIIMKLAGGLIIWITIAVIWFRWAAEEREWDKVESSLRVG